MLDNFVVDSLQWIEITVLFQFIWDSLDYSKATHRNTCIDQVSAHINIGISSDIAETSQPSSSEFR
jgi:hypothetical protein